jgi:hypothetical protein
MCFGEQQAESQIESARIESDDQRLRVRTTMRVCAAGCRHRSRYPMTTTWTIGVDADNAELRERLAKKYPLTSKHKIAKLCLAYATRAMARAPELLVEEAAACTDSDRGTACDTEVTP